ncbi:MAG: type II secretion system GspH family protein [Candidatus Omnitrophica bacterium]|nr:type II secretion system GspH family protein [Candidatus Omnitrophota bacterium]
MLRTGKMKNKGFLLLEVMVSVTILSIGLVLILSSFIRSIKAIELSEDYFRAGLLFEEKIYEVHNTDGEIFSDEGVFEDFGSRFSWNLAVESVDEDELKNLYDISLEISWDHGSKKCSMLVPTYIYQTS